MPDGVSRPTHRRTEFVCLPKPVLNAFVYNVPRPAGYFDIVSCANVLDWVDDPDALVSDLRHLLRPGGLLVISSTAVAPDLEFRTKGQVAMGICADCYADGLEFDFACGDEVYGSCTQLREFFEASGQAYVLRVAATFVITLATGAKAACADTVKRLLKDKRRWEVRSAGKGSKGERWYAWAWIATASPRHHLLVRRHLKNGELAFHYGYVPEGQLLTKTRLIRAAGLRWPVEEDFELGKDCLGLDQCQARL